MIKVMNTISGQTALVPERILKHPVLGKNLVIADEGQKSYIPEMYEPKNVEEFVESKPKRSKKTTDTEDVVEESIAYDFNEIEDE